MKEHSKKDMSYIAMVMIAIAMSMFIIACEDPNSSAKVGGGATRGIRSWTKVSTESSALFSKRSEHTSVINSSGRIYVIGGYNNSYLNDVWKSEDRGKTWLQVATGSPDSNNLFSKRRGHTSVIDSKNNIYVIGGYDSSDRLNDVWKSADGGKTWTQINTDTNAVFPKRSEHTSVIDSSGHIYVIGGYNGETNGYLNDVWKSENEGKTWTEVTSKANFSERSGHTSIINSAGHIYVIGGNFGDTYLNDVWKSEDEGKTWAEVTSEANFSKRSNHTSVIDSAGNVYVIGGDGKSNNKSNKLNDVWQSVDGGNTWIKITSLGTLTSDQNIQNHTSVIDSAGNIYIIGGYDGINYFNDVWRYGN